MIPVSSAESLADTRKATRLRKDRRPGALRQCNDGGSGHEASPETSRGGMRCYLDRLVILANLWSIAGCFKVRQGTEGTEATHCRQEDSYDYVRGIKRRAKWLWKRFPEKDVLQRVSAAEEHIREVAIDLSGVPYQLTWGQALRRAAQEQSHHWADVCKEL